MPDSKEVIQQNRKYNEALGHLYALSLPAERIFADDLKNTNDPFFYLIANLIQQDPEFYKKIEEHSVGTKEDLNDAFNKIVNALDKKRGILQKQISYWEVKLPTASEASKKTIQAHIDKVKKLERINFSALIILESESKDLDVILKKQKQIIELQKNVAQLDQEDASLKVLYARHSVSDSFIALDVEKLKKYASKQVITDEISKTVPSFEKELVVKSESRKEQQKKRGIDSEEGYLVEDDLFRVSKTNIDNKSIITGESDNYFVYLNGKQINRDGLKEERNNNPLFDRALRYYDSAMQSSADVFLKNATYKTFVAGKTILRFDEHEKGMYFSSEVQDSEIPFKTDEMKDEFKETEVMQGTKRKKIAGDKVVPGKTISVYKFNDEIDTDQSNFEWVGLFASNSLLGNMLNADAGDYKKLNDEQIKLAQEEEYVNAMALLKNFMSSLKKDSAAHPIVKWIYLKIETIKKEHSDVADLELLTRVATQVTKLGTELTQANDDKHPAVEILKENAKLLAEVHDKYDNEFTIGLIVFLIVVGVGLSFTGIGALAGLVFLEFAIDAAVALTSFGAASLALSGVLYKDAKDSKKEAESNLHTHTSKPLITGGLSQSNVLPAVPQQQQQQQQPGMKK